MTGPIVEVPLTPSRRAQEPASRGGGRTLRWAWVAVGLIPVAFVVAMVAGEALIDALGYPAEGPEPPVWLALVVGGPVTLLAMSPAVLAVVFGRRAGRHGGGRAATTATAIGSLVTAYWALTFAGSVAQRLTD